MSNPEIGGNAHTPNPNTNADPGRPGPAAIAAFVTAIRAAFGDTVDEHHDPTVGWRWTWAQRGIWTLSVGGILTTEPVIYGPAGTWRLDLSAIADAELVLLMLRLAGGLPTRVSPRQVAATGSVYGTAALPRRLAEPTPLPPRPAPTPVPDAAPGRVLNVSLTPVAPPHPDGHQDVTLPSGRIGTVDLRQECRIVDTAPDTGAMTVIVVAAPPADRHPHAPIPAVLHEAARGGPFARYAPQVVNVEPPVPAEMPPAAGLELPARGAGVTEAWKIPARTA